jgi:NhaP-type Na+/H+ or K+/H+ antiporter
MINIIGDFLFYFGLGIASGLLIGKLIELVIVTVKKTKY